MGSVAENVLAHGCGGLNIDACRVSAEGGTRGCNAGPSNGILGDGLNGTFGKPVPGLGRWPANVVTDGSDEVLEEFAAFGESTSSDRPRKNGNFASVAKGRDKVHVTHGHADTGTAARFFDGSKAGARDRVIH